MRKHEGCVREKKRWAFNVLPSTLAHPPTSQGPWSPSIRLIPHASATQHTPFIMCVYTCQHEPPSCRVDCVIVRGYTRNSRCWPLSDRAVGHEQKSLFCLVCLFIPQKTFPPHHRTSMPTHQCADAPVLTETIRIQLVTFGMQNRTHGSYLAAIQGNPYSTYERADAPVCHGAHCTRVSAQTLPG
jgi:hypothetical protein